jgi:hypothetical protein
LRPSTAAPVTLDWPPTYRLVLSRFPPISLFERVADPADLDHVFAIEALTNPRLRQEAGDISLVPTGDRISGAGSSAVMAAFTHLNPAGSRFADGSYGVYYAAKALETAVHEVAYHQEQFLAATREEAIAVDLRCYRAPVLQPLHDIRGARLPSVYSPDSYAASQTFGRRLRERQSHGIVYDSVRHAGGECVAVFRPVALGPAVQGEHVTLMWDGSRIASWYVKSDLRPL